MMMNSVTNKDMMEHPEEENKKALANSFAQKEVRDRDRMPTTHALATEDNPR